MNEFIKQDLKAIKKLMPKRKVSKHVITLVFKLRTPEELEKDRCSKYNYIA